VFAYLRKMWAQIGGAIATLVYSLITDGGIIGLEWAVLLTQGVAIVLVWYVDNTGQAPYAKGMSAFWSAASVVFMVAVPDGVTSSEWGQILIAGATAVVVLMVPNAGRTGAATPPVVAGGGTVAP
jgi:phosphatidylserine synthase